jgi:hypothetical protein
VIGPLSVFLNTSRSTKGISGGAKLFAFAPHSIRLAPVLFKFSDGRKILKDQKKTTRNLPKREEQPFVKGNKVPIFNIDFAVMPNGSHIISRMPSQYSIATRNTLHRFNGSPQSD